MRKNNIILIGMPASGKSTLGKALAKKLGWKFVDTDKLIRKSQGGKSLKEIIDQVGNEEFLKIEDDINTNVNGEFQVISPGGSVIFCKNAMKHYKEIGIVIYLKINYYLLSERLKDPIARGVVLKKGQTIKDIYKVRKPYFEKYADYIFKVKRRPIKVSIERLCNIIKSELA